MKKFFVSVWNHFFGQRPEWLFAEVRLLNKLSRKAVKLYLSDSLSDREKFHKLEQEIKKLARTNLACALYSDDSHSDRRSFLKREEEARLMVAKMIYRGGWDCHRCYPLGAKVENIDGWREERRIVDAEGVPALVYILERQKSKRAPWYCGGGDPEVIAKYLNSAGGWSTPQVWCEGFVGCEEVKWFTSSHAQMNAAELIALKSFA